LKVSATMHLTSRRRIRSHDRQQAGMWNYISPERHSRLDDRSGGAACSHKQGPREATLVSHGHALMENRHGVAVAGGVTRADGSAERAAALAEVGPVATTRAPRRGI